MHIDNNFYLVFKESEDVYLFFDDSSTTAPTTPASINDLISNFNTFSDLVASFDTWNDLANYKI